MMRSLAASVLALWGTAAAAQQTSVTLRPDTDALVASVVLGEPAASFAFESYNIPQRAAAWTAGDEFAFDGETVRRADGAAFQRFTLRLPRDDRFHDRRYVAVDRVGESGWTVLLPALRAAEGETVVAFEDFGPGAQLIVSGETPQAAPFAPISVGEEARLAYVGPTANIDDGAMRLIAGEEVPAWLRERLIADVGGAVERLTERFAAAPETPPILVVTYDALWDGYGVKGGVLHAGTIEFRLRGMALDEADQTLADVVANGAAHEAVHIWNGGLWRDAENNEQPWLAEGGAEYLASRLWQDAESLREETARRLNGCLLRQDRRPLDGSQGQVAGEPPYDCGFVVQLAAEAASLQAGAGDVFDLWRALFDGADAEGFYTPVSFRAEAERRGGPAVATLMDLVLAAADAQDPEAIARALTDLGVETELRAADAREGRTALVMTLQPVLMSLCGGSSSFYTFENRIVLGTGDRCGAALAGDPAVVAVNGASLVTDPIGAHAAVHEACANGGALTFATPEGEPLEPVACAAEIAPLPRVFEVTALPDLPAP